MDSTSLMDRRLLAVLIAALIAVGLTFVGTAQASAALYNPEAVISNANMRDSKSMSEKEIQAFLETQTGPLDTLVAKDYAGVKKPASKIIWEACQAWGISPKVMLTMLQKEQSLLTRTTLAKNTLSRAIGAGCPDSKTNRYPGFGKQMWNGTRMLDGYGEAGKTTPYVKLYYSGIKYGIYKIDGMTHIHPKNLATYKLYVYNPSIGAKKPYGNLSTQACSGNANFWKIYRKYFGSTYANPRMQRVFRFRNKSNGTFYYTKSVTKWYHLRRKHSKAWAYSGVACSIDSSATSPTVPVYRFLNKRTRKYSQTRSAKVAASRRSAAGRKKWTYKGFAFRASVKATAKSVPVYCMRNKKTGAHYLTTSKKKVAALRKTAALRRTWAYDGVRFHLPRYVAP